MENIKPSIRGSCFLDLLNDDLGDTETLINCYADLEFLDDQLSLKDVKCVKCDKVAIAHGYSNCNHIFCKPCKTVMTQGSKCPMCKSAIDKITRTEMTMTLKIYGLKTFCPNKRLGCSHISTLLEIPEHLKSCEYDESSTICEWAKDNFNQTDELVEKTFHAVSDKISELEEELKVDALTAMRDLDQLTRNVNNKLQNFRKRLSVVLKDVEAPLQTSTDELDSRKLEDEVKFFQEQETQTSADININIKQEITDSKKVDLFLVSLEERTEFACVIANLQSIIANKTEVSSPVFDIYYHPIDMQTKFNIFKEKDKDGRLHLFAYGRVKFTGRFNQKPCFPKNTPLPKITYILHDVSGKQEHIVTVEEFGFGTVLNDEDDHYKIILDLGTDPQSYGRYIMNDSMTFLMCVEFPHLCQRPYSTNGTLLWKITDCEIKCKSHIVGLSNYVYSPYFYTFKRGHRVQAKMRFEKSIPRFYLDVLTGEFDSLLPNASLYKVTFILFGKNGNPHEEVSYVLPSADAVLSNGKNPRLLMTHSWLGSNMYINKDTILVKICMESMGTL